MEEKKKLLCWSDNPVAGTGFGVVSRYVIGSLWNTGRYEIDQLAINFSGEFVDKKIVPWELQPAKVQDPNDPHGLKMFLNCLGRKKYDLVWVMNDLFVTSPLGPLIVKVRDEYRKRGWKPPVFVYYYPVDCKVKPESTGFLDVCDIPVCYTQHGREETLKVRPELKDKLIEIPHGVDSSIYRPLSQEERQGWREKFFNLKSTDTLVINVNRNSMRKQLPYCMLAFKKFLEVVPNAKLYLHTAAVDQGGNMETVIRDIGLPPEKVVFPRDYRPSRPVSSETLNRIYNCADLFLNTSLGEGYGLFTGECLASGTTLVTGRNTCMPQIIGENEERGYLYPCNDWAWIDESGFRQKGLIPDIADTMFLAYLENKRYGLNNPKKKAALEWAAQNDWNVINRRWVELFKMAEELEFAVKPDLDVIEL